MKSIELDQRLIVFEGLSGIGKDTVIEYVYFKLNCDGPVSVEKQPTRSLYGERALIRLRKGLNDLETTMLMLLDRYVHMSTLNDRVDPDAIVLMNRYGLSTMVYQKEEHANLISKFHQFLPVPSLTIVLDSCYEKWVEANKEHFVARRKGADRGNFRKELRNPQVYETYRRMYLTDHVPHITGPVKIVQAFDNLDEMSDNIIEAILNSGSATATELSYESKLLSQSLHVRTSEVKGTDTARNKVLMVEIERFVYEWLSKNPEVGVDDVHIGMNPKRVSKVIGNVIQRLQNQGAIESTGRFRQKSRTEEARGPIIIYQKGKNFKAWEPGI